MTAAAPVPVTIAELLTPALDPRAHALRPVRVIGDALRGYDAVTFPRDPYAGCSLALRRCAVFGFLKDTGDHIVVDVLDCDGDIVQDYPLTRAGFEYLRRALKLRRSPGG